MHLLPPTYHARQWLKNRLEFLWKPTPGFRWLIEPPPLAGRKVCLLACFSSSGNLSDHTLFVVRQWQSHGFVVILIVASDRAATLQADAMGVRADGLVLRRNTGYDFGSWASVVKACPAVRQAGLLAMANDSLYGPLRGFGDLLARVEASAAEVVGMTDSYEEQHHVQSYLMFYKPRALADETFRRLWCRDIFGGRYEIITKFEVTLLGRLQAGGLRVDVLFPTHPNSPVNPTIDGWRALLDAGFPFVKVQLFRDKVVHRDLPAWDLLLAERSYDPTLIARHLGATFAGSAAGQTASAGFNERLSR